MKKVLLLLLSAAMVLVSCSAPKGLSVARAKQDLVIRGVNNIENYDPNKPVLATDSLLLNGPPQDDSQVIVLKKKANGDYLIPGGAASGTLPKYIFQLKDQVFYPDDYVWAAGISADYKIKTLLADELLDNAGRRGSALKPLKRGNRETKSMATDDQTFDVFGSEIKAVPLKSQVAYYEPAKLSFMLGDNIEATQLILFSYNNQDVMVIDLNGPEVERLGLRTRAVEIDLKYGNRFTLVDGQGRFPNISPKLIADRRILLSGVKLAKNDGGEPFYVFQVMAGGQAEARASAVAGEPYDGEDDGSDGALLSGSGCSGYENIKLPPARQALNKNYPNGFIRLDCCDLYTRDKALFLRLVGIGAIGRERSGRNQATTRVNPEWLKEVSPSTYQRYKKQITNN